MDCLHDHRYAVTIHGDDVLAHNNWEIAESWLQRYKYVLPIRLWVSVKLIYGVSGSWSIQPR